MYPRMFFIPLAFALLFFAATPQAATISQTTYGDFSEVYDLYADGTDAGVDDEGMTEPQRFDPNLGTLTGISFSVLSGQLSWDAKLWSHANDAGPFEAVVQGQFLGEIVYEPTGQVIASVFDRFDLSCSGSEGTGDYCEFIGSNAVEFVSAPQLLIGFDPLAFTEEPGIDQVEGIVLRGSLVGASFAASTNIETSLTNINGTFGLTDVMLQTTYIYDPAVVPIPAAAWLFASALGVFGYLGKRKAAA